MGNLGGEKICAVAAAPSATAMLQQLRRARRITRTVELRLDWLSDDAEIERFLRFLRKGKPRATLIATCRRRDAGGRYRGSIATQLTYLSEALCAGCRWYDLEIETVRRCPPELIDALLGDGRQLRSAHFFTQMPRDLGEVVRELTRGRPEAIKIAAQCSSFRDARKMLELAKRRKNVVAIPMGEVAEPVRILALGAKNGFAYAPLDEATAPGQTSLAELTKVYRADHIDSGTRIYGVIGDPIAHSLSPAMQNAAFSARRRNAIYLPFLVHDLKDFIGAIRDFGIRGFSVTLPHKERILKYLDDCDPLAARIGAVNTVAVRGEGKLCGYNTDYAGILRTLEKRIPLQSSRVLIAGAGGAARAIAYAVAEAGGEVCVYARRQHKAKALAKAVNGEAMERRALRSEFFDAIVNATPVGMYPHAESSPLEARELNCRLVFDTIYRPRKTRLLELAERRGAETVSGVEMFVAQGAAQFEIWTGEPAPVKAMRRAVIAALQREEKLGTNRKGRRQSR